MVQQISHTGPRITTIRGGSVFRGAIFADFGIEEVRVLIEAELSDSPTLTERLILVLPVVVMKF